MGEREDDLNEYMEKWRDVQKKLDRALNDPDVDPSTVADELNEETE